MKNFFYFLLLFGGIISFYACEEEVKNPGDYNLKSKLIVTGATAKSGVNISLNVIRSIDSTYVRFYEKDDTLKDALGAPVIDPSGKYTITKDTVYYNGKITAKFFELEPVLLDSPIDTIHISLESNAKWVAPMPGAGGKAQWFFTQRLAGGGDGTVIAAVPRNRNNKRAVDAVQYVMTSDSAVMYKLTFGQKGEKDK